jgi:hypothetical protein
MKVAILGAGAVEANPCARFRREPRVKLSQI